MRLSPRGNPGEVDPEEAFYHMQDLGMDVQGRISGNSPVDTAELRGSWELHITSNSFTVGSRLPQASYTEYGTPSPITPKNGEFLTFRVGGRWVRVRQVAGQVAQRYVLYSLRRIFPDSRISSK